jgi:hypothetical protein
MKSAIDVLHLAYRRLDTSIFEAQSRRRRKLGIKSKLNLFEMMNSSKQIVTVLKLFKKSIKGGKAVDN